MTEGATKTIIYDKFFFSVFQLLLEKGLKDLTMDYVASSLGMSKRTLYERFDSKTDMIVKTMSHMAECRRRVSDEIFSAADNSVVALIQAYYIQRNFVSNVNKCFFEDMDRFFSGIKKYYDAEARNEYTFVNLKFQAGIKEGVFRSDINYKKQLLMVSLQLESLKRMEDRLPTDISLIEAYDILYGNFMYAIVTEKGRTILEECINNKELIVKDIEKYLYKNETEF